jgi:hypothetical protein
MHLYVRYNHWHRNGTLDEECTRRCSGTCMDCKKRLPALTVYGAAVSLD